MNKRIDKKIVGLVCSGGDAPGINNLIYGLFRELQNNFNLVGFVDGFGGIFENKIQILNNETVESIQLEGSSIIGCERFENFHKPNTLKKIISNLQDLKIEHLVIFGGNGSLKAAKILKEKGIKVHFIPTTIDNDVIEVETTLGFDTALNGIVEYIRRINYSAKNHKKVQLYELMGRDCSDLTNLIGSSVYADYVINNENYLKHNLVDDIAEKINTSKTRTNIVILSERLLDAKKIVDDLSKKISKRIWFTVVGHFQRGGAPSFGDCLYASNCSFKISQNILKDKSNFIYSMKEEVNL